MPIVTPFEFPFLYAWGANALSQLGLGTTGNRSSPVVVGSNDWVQISSCGHTLAIRSDGSLWGWGGNASGQLGLNHTNNVTVPTKIGTDSWIAVATSSGGFSVAIRSDGSLFSWGANASGQLGINTVTSRSSPVQIGANLWSRIRLGFSHVVAIRSDGGLYAWGANGANQVGDGTATSRSSPVQVGGLVSWSQIGAAGIGSYGIRDVVGSFSLYQWGFEPVGGGTNATPSLLHLGPFARVSAGNAMVHAIAADGTLWGGGQNASGQLGNGTFASPVAFAQISAEQDWVEVQDNHTTVIALKGDGRLLAWGANALGQVGDGTTINRNVPTTIAPSQRFKKLSIPGIDGGNTCFFAMSEYPSDFDCLPADDGFSNPIYVKWFERVGVWIAVGIEHPVTGFPYVLRSAGNGAPWSDRPLPASLVELYSVCDSGTHLVATGAFSTTHNEVGIIRSADGGLTWARITGVNVGNLFDVINEGITGNLLAVGRRGAPSPTEVATLWSSDDNGATWTVRFTGSSNDDGYATACVWDGTNWVVVGTPTVTGQSLIMTSPDRIAWTSRTANGPNLGGSPATPLGVGAYLRIAIGDGKIVAAARPNFIVVSEDNGVTWTHTATIPGVLFSGQLFWSGTEWALATTQNFYDRLDGRNPGGAGVYYTSPDAVTWTPQYLHSRLASPSGRGPAMGYRASNGETHIFGKQGSTLRLGPDLPEVNGLYAWGFNNVGQLGINTTTARSSPTQVGEATTWTKVATLSTNGTAIQSNGTLWTWGNSDSGQLGNLTAGGANYRSSPIQVGALTDWAEVIDSGYGVEFMGAIKTNGTLWMWGGNHEGQLGIGTTTNRSSPTQVGGLTNWHQLTATEFSAAAVKTDNTLWTWGRNNVGQLGNNTLVSQSSPIQLGAAVWSQVSGGLSHIGAVRTDGTLWMWGLNSNGQLGVNDIVSRSSPVQVGALTDWADVHCGANHTIARKMNGTLWAWGHNSNGQLGLNIGVGNLRSSPVQIGTDTDWIQARAGFLVSTALRANGTLWTWGTNGQGALGINVGGDRSSPVQVGSQNNWHFVDCGGGSSDAQMHGIRG